jgi:uncharacterized RDD family membrane protein YckC
MRYAGFWVRFWAAMVDSIVLTPLSILVYLKFETGSIGFLSASAQVILFLVVSVITPWLYYSLFESGGWQATPGKRLMDLRVVDLLDRKISFARASARYFSKIASSIILGIGYIMAGVTDNKQALHDKIADTLVLRGQPNKILNNVSIGSTFGEAALPDKNHNWVFAGFDDQGHVIRLTFKADDSRLVGPGLVIGRDSKNSDLSINSQSVSRRHARLYKINNVLFVEDLNSTNGIFINKKSVSKINPTEIPDRGEIVIGNVELSIGRY